MSSSSNPIVQIKWAYEGRAPIFNNFFIDQFMQYFYSVEKEAFDLLDYLLLGPVENLKLLDWNMIMPILINSLPDTIKIVYQVLLTIQNLRICFLRNDGLILLKSCLQNNEYINYIADMLLVLSSEHFDDMTLEHRSQKINLTSEEIGINFIDTDAENTCDYAQIFFELCEKIIQCSDENIVHKIIRALNWFAQSNKRHSGNVSSILITYLMQFSDISIVSHVFNTLSDIFQPSMFPYIQQISDILLEFSKNDDDELTTSMCSFINSISNIESDLLDNPDIIRKLLLLTDETSFKIKKSAAISLLRLLRNTSIETFFEIIEYQNYHFLGILNQLISIENPNVMLDILKVYNKILKNYSELKLNNDVIYQFFDVLSLLKSNEDRRISNISSFLLQNFDIIQNGGIPCLYIE